MLEKILEEIDKYKKCCLRIGDAKEYNSGALKMAEVIEEIIRKHMNGGWIPVKERLPEVQEDLEDDDCPEFNVMIDSLGIVSTLRYSPDGSWFDGSGEVYEVIAWQPLPEPYRKE